MWESNEPRPRCPRGSIFAASVRSALLLVDSHGPACARRRSPILSNHQGQSVARRILVVSASGYWTWHRDFRSADRCADRSAAPDDARGLPVVAAHLDRPEERGASACVFYILALVDGF